MRFGLRLSALLVMLVTTQAHGGWFGPSNLSECLTEAVKRRTAEGVRLATRLCQQNFPPTKKDCEDEARAWRDAKVYEFDQGTVTLMPVPAGHCSTTYPWMFRE
jgi:hypothetical protein